MNIGLANRRRTLLLVDGDAHARAGLRNALEQAGFSVGEAANAREGELTAQRVHPDAIIADLMLESIDAGSQLALNLRSRHLQIPFYLISNAGEALMGSFALQDQGICGVFLKPVDTQVVAQTLLMRLAAG